MELTQQEIYQDLGLEPDEPAGQETEPGENGQGAAHPAQEGENERGTASPADEGGAAQASASQSAETNDTEGREEDRDGDGREGQGLNAKQEMSVEERRRQAALRRQAEERARAQAQQAALDEAYRNAFAGRLNPYTGRPILSQADFLEYQRAQEAERSRRQAEKLQKAGIDQAALQSMVESLPVIQQARQALSQAQEAKARAEATQAKAWFTGQLKEIAALGLDPDVTTLEDLAGKYPEKYPEMMDRVRRGSTLAEAYRTVNFEAILEKRTAAARQAALNSTADKGHLKASGPAGGQGGGAVEVPSDVRQMYQELNPGISDADIRKEYAEFLKLTGAS